MAHSTSVWLLPTDKALPEGRSHLPGEHVCVWLTELYKPDGIERIRGALSGATANQVVQLYTRIREHAGAQLRHALDQASKTGSTRENKGRLEEVPRCGLRLKTHKLTCHGCRWTVVVPAAETDRPEEHICPHCGAQLSIEWRDSKLSRPRPPGRYH